jgi:biopolymer transport protein TolR
MSSANMACARVRGRIRREIAAAEDAEIEGGELNLVPYMDILVNTIIFLLATINVTVALANINVNSPRYEQQAAGAVAPETPSEEDQKLNLTVAISYKGFIVGARGAMLPGPDGSVVTVKCLVPLEQDRCPVFQSSRRDPATGKQEPTWIDRYDYKSLTNKMREIKQQYKIERQAILTADRLVPYKVVVETMDTLRGKLTDKCTGDDGCLFDQVILSAGVQ